METVLQGTVDILMEIGRCYGIEINVEKKLYNENLEASFTNTNYDRKQQENVEYFNYLGSITNK